MENKNTPSKSKSRSTVKRAPKRGIYEREEINHILDNSFMCHVGFIHNGRPVVIPTMYGRDGDSLLIHGASVSRLITELEHGIDVCISMANVKGLVLARSAFHHSLNYESVVVFGKGKLVADDEKEAALKLISDHLIKGRWEESRKPNTTELKATKVLRIEIEEISGKRREGPPIDDKADYELDIWAGVLEVNKTFGKAEPDPLLKEGVPMAGSVLTKQKN